MSQSQRFKFPLAQRQNFQMKIQNELNFNIFKFCNKSPSRFRKSHKFRITIGWNWNILRSPQQGQEDLDRLALQAVINAMINGQVKILFIQHSDIT